MSQQHPLTATISRADLISHIENMLPEKEAALTAATAEADEKYEAHVQSLMVEPVVSYGFLGLKKRTRTITEARNYSSYFEKRSIYREVRDLENKIQRLKSLRDFMNIELDVIHLTERELWVLRP